MGCCASDTDGENGFDPSNFDIQRMEIKDAVVTIDHNGNRKNKELTVKIGERIKLYGDVTPDNWILAKNNEGYMGYIPEHYYNIIVVEEPISAKPSGMSGYNNNNNIGNYNGYQNNGYNASAPNEGGYQNGNNQGYVPPEPF
mmetsp:Transcript_54675/g.67087  ORF Transcript_54675/g.67087 Transcript_54675/m.67087 type:complete len:142 (+) Transcript_54675:57-482(+)